MLATSQVDEAIKFSREQLQFERSNVQEIGPELANTAETLKDSPDPAQRERARDLFNKSLTLDLEDFDKYRLRSFLKRYPRAPGHPRRALVDAIGKQGMHIVVVQASKPAVRPKGCTSSPSATKNPTPALPPSTDPASPPDETPPRASGNLYTPSKAPPRPSRSSTFDQTAHSLESPDQQPATAPSPAAAS